LFAFGCTKDEEKPAETTTQGTATISGKISISGSTSVKPVVAAMAEAFEEINGDAEIDIQEGGSSVGIDDATEKKVDMGMSSRELKDTGNRTQRDRYRLRRHRGYRPQGCKRG
jgi:phosphate transport system substrate-binding protein